jgi:hypothetical protein
MTQVAFWANVTPIAMEVHPLRGPASVSVDFKWCHYGKEGSRPCDFHEPLLGVFRSEPSPWDARETQQPASSLPGLQFEVS